MEIQFRELRTQMKLAKARILIVMFVVVFVLAVKSRYNHHQEIIGLQDSLSNFYKDFDTSMFADLPALKKLLNKIQEMPEQLVKLEEIHKASESVRQKIEILQNFELDKTGRTDLALWNSGGRIAGIGADTKPFYSCNFFARLAGCPNKVNGPEKVIQSTMHPGECFRFQGNKGTVYIRLANDAILDAVTVEHLTMQMSPTGEVSSAPKEFSVSVKVFPVFLDRDFPSSSSQGNREFSRIFRASKRILSDFLCSYFTGPEQSVRYAVYLWEIHVRCQQDFHRNLQAAGSLFSVSLRAVRLSGQQRTSKYDRNLPIASPRRGVEGNSSKLMIENLFLYL